jgi:hypothetical protein
MSYDLAIGPSGDLLFAGNMDLLGVSGEDLTNQRIRNRLKIVRGSWVFDTNQTLGSRLDRVLREGNNAYEQVVTFVHEALDEMDDIIVGDISVFPDPNDTRGTTMILKVFYTMAPAGDEAPFSATDEQLQSQEATITFQQ